MPAVILLSCVAVLLGVAGLAAAMGRSAAATPIVYGASLVASLVACLTPLVHLVADAGATPGVTLPLGLPWLGAHFRIDALAAFFLVVVNLGGGAASLYALGYGRHEPAPLRVLPFYPAFLAGMNLVVLADDAFTFLLSWEFMSLASWALVMAHHRVQDKARAGYIYLQAITIPTPKSAHGRTMLRSARVPGAGLPGAGVRRPTVFPGAPENGPET
jgi:formate hydrogenlyase subunit 3/multisubunit Na+/H+ antiporter MnhD subunit